MGKPKRSMHEKFNLKMKDKDAKDWLKAKGFTPPHFEDARGIEGLPKFVQSYFARHKITTNNEEQEPNA